MVKYNLLKPYLMERDQSLLYSLSFKIHDFPLQIHIMHHKILTTIL